MSSEKILDFLQKKEEEKAKQEAQLRYKILSHYGLGEAIYYKEGDNPNDFPLRDETGDYKFKYICDVSDEDYEKIKTIYANEDPNSENVINEGAEKALNACAIIVLILGIIAFIALWVNSYEEHYELYRSSTTFNWNTFGTGAGILLVSIINLAFSRVIINISRKLNKLK